ncbi:hypothetical protein P4637_07765 [Halalkalibacterium halodurans]|jgi:hypothetical protein|uniref:BH1460 protein n=1 Tax=Halalkalibacterium halodurans (strain ATCC BAA-125 / DSM 18197 / FERM 7344 / JCM 9153 / C-125) TaxID=272558 RepID=Q9KCV9_HALH5|nr:hypothetical protein [Halalkalibacterium halodurans]MDY7221981.1 hypothetical protein [Halalkalibacterium halodurans]MDY7241257.1 hypothetical protein [Halalkalibacterium halodurans]MED3648066.1 hypothetical protein [Halalkalibacterium halodurans]MED4082872.1 hypothetical protein [Halalkalibacterium halodurans]MED4084758.1 hypothetical protein [Halalkalibacterium halodurans]
MSKKVLFSILSGVLALNVLAACGGDTEDPANEEEPALEEDADAADEAEEEEEA